MCVARFPDAIRALTLVCLAAAQLPAQRVTLRGASNVELPTIIDGNSAAFWSEKGLTLFHSSGVPTLSRGSDQFTLGAAQSIAFDSPNKPVWFEAAWRDEDGTLFLWYHHEPGGVCGNGLTAPKIGAAVSYDDGATVRDLGIVLESSEHPDCSAKNGFFAGGHGDASVILDRDKQYFYFFFTNYGGPAEQQGVSVARMAFENRFHPSGAVMKYFDRDWSEPGLGGRQSPIFKASRAWEFENADSFWGPSVHWNRHLERYVIFLNRACCSPGWPQEGVYFAIHNDLANPSGWIEPVKLMSREMIPWGPGWYPQVLGLDPGDTDSVAGQVARFYVHGKSIWEIEFSRPEENPQEPGPTEPENPDSDECSQTSSVLHPDPTSPDCAAVRIRTKTRNSNGSPSREVLPPSSRALIYGSERPGSH